ncbi:DUF4132 domain-containing protein [Glycomyces paridis]|uniref:DUF4132 domain-containing protein n=1 Tax=Glycomyces paridis TaxID=2126555 RepID=A0A4S8PJ50_9ACTN|nr:DUF4132 domain-containing protein [Glycomyces paridis]THV30700.1 DUF4132 domain-containing protein [Glycomyces paridis]
MTLNHVTPTAAIELPPTWAARTLPRRGRGPAPEVALDPEAPEALRQAIEEGDDLLGRILDMRKNRRHTNAVRAYLAGEPDAKGAAATGTFLRYSGVREPNWWTRTELHAWVQTHGLAWAVRACIERGAVETNAGAGYGRSRLGHFVLQPAARYAARPLVDDLDSGTAAELRALLAAASEEDYAAAVAAAAEHRGTPEHRLGAAFYFPEQEDWVAEAGAEYRDQLYYGNVDRLLLHSASTPEHLAAMGIEELHHYHADAERAAALVHAVGADAVPVLARTLGPGSRFGRDTTKTLFKAVALIPTAAAAAFLVDALDRPFAFDAAAESAARAPVAMLRAVAGAAENADTRGRGRLAALAARIDAGAAAQLTGPERDALDRLTAATAGVPEADPADLPPLLTAPPWTRKRPKAKPLVIAGLEPPAGTRLVWPEGERERLLAEADAVLADDRAELVSFWHEYAEQLRFTDHDARLGALVAFGPLDLAEKMVATWVEKELRPGYGEAQTIMARFGEIGVPAAHRARGYCGTSVLMPVLDTEAARFAAERLTRSKATFADGAAWLDHHGLAAVPHLVPDAFGPEPKARKAAESALAHLARRLGADAVIAAAPAEAATALHGLVGGDPLEPRGVKVPKPGAWAAPPMFPQVLLKGGERALPAASIPHLLTVLALATPEHPYPGIAVVAETCDRASLARFSRAVFEQWLAVGAPPKDAWALTQLAHFAEDETVWTLAARVREWPGQSQHKRAVAGLGVLGAIGTEEALRAIQGIADKVRFAALKHEASVQIEAIAAGLGLDRDQLADRLVPEFGLGETVDLDYGPRTFTVAFDEHLKPFVVDDAGKPRKALPRPGANDDPELAEDAYKRFAALKKELKAVAAEQVARLETAMIRGRTWTPAEFRRFFVEHALTGHLARRLVWLADGTGFRIAEDLTLSDLEDDAFDLPDDAAVRIAHPVLLGAEAVDSWASLLADYEILQPFDQLARPVMALTEEELDTGHLARFEGATVDVGRLIGMTRKGWTRAAPEDGGMCPGVAFALAEGRFVTVAVEPGIYAGYPGEFPEQTVRGVHLDHGEYYRHEPGPALDRDHRRPERLDPVAVSEALTALARLTGA